MLTKEHPWNKSNPPHIYRINFSLFKMVFFTDLSTGLISRKFTITFTKVFLSNHMLIHSLLGHDRLLPNSSDVTSQSCAEGALTSAVRAVSFKELKEKQVVDNYVRVSFLGRLKSTLESTSIQNPANKLNSILSLQCVNTTKGRWVAIHTISWDITWTKIRYIDRNVKGKKDDEK
jgi:hypothetical protein